MKFGQKSRVLALIRGWGGKVAIKGELPPLQNPVSSNTAESIFLPFSSQHTAFHTFTCLWTESCKCFDHIDRINNKSDKYVKKSEKKFVRGLCER